MSRIVVLSESALSIRKAHCSELMVPLAVPNRELCLCTSVTRYSALPSRRRKKALLHQRLIKGDQPLTGRTNFQLIEKESMVWLIGRTNFLLTVTGHSVDGEDKFSVDQKGING